MTNLDDVEMLAQTFRKMGQAQADKALLKVGQTEAIGLESFRKPFRNMVYGVLQPQLNDPAMITLLVQLATEHLTDQMLASFADRLRRHRQGPPGTAERPL